MFVYISVQLIQEDLANVYVAIEQAAVLVEKAQKIEATDLAATDRKHSSMSSFTSLPTGHHTLYNYFSLFNPDPYICYQYFTSTQSVVVC